MLKAQPIAIAQEEIREKGGDLLPAEDKPPALKLLGFQLIIGQLDAHRFRRGIQRLKEHIGVALRLTQVLSLLDSQLFQGQGGGFDLVDSQQSVLSGEHAIGPPLQKERKAAGLGFQGEGDLLAVVAGHGFLDFPVGGRPLLHGGGVHIAAIDIAAAQHPVHYPMNRQLDAFQCAAPPFDENRPPFHGRRPVISVLSGILPGPACGRYPGV